MAQIVVRIPEDMAEWLEAEHPGRGDVSRLVRRLLQDEKDGSIPNGFIPSVEGSPAGTGLRQVEERAATAPAESPPDSPKKARACAHSETIFKMGARYCVKCGEFV